EEGQIAALHQRALDNDVESMSLISAAAAIALEPNLHCLSALLSGETGIVDSHGYMLALRADLEANGAIVALNAPVLGGAVLARGGFEVRIGGAAPALVKCNTVVNAAGLYAQAVARSIEGMTAENIPPLVLAKGSYFGCGGRSAFTRLIYPAPVEGGLGVHLT